MDTKLARGLTRQSIRQDRAEYPSVVRGMQANFKPFLEKYLFRGRLKKDEASAFLKRIIAVKTDPHEWVFSETFSNPSIKSLSPDFDFAFVGGCMSTGKWGNDQREETVRVYQVFADRIRRTSFDYRFHYTSLLVREHAISRYIEFADASYKSLSSALWPGILILELFDPHDRTAIVHPIMIPTPKGAFLGLRILEPITDYSHQTYNWAFGQDTQGPMNLMPNAPPVGMRTYINTFVDEDRLSPTQDEVRTALASTLSRHRDALMHAHLAKVMQVGDEPDTFGLSTRYSGDSFEEAANDLRRLMQTPAWRDAIRMPSEGVFERHIERQRKLVEAAGGPINPFQSV